MLAQIIATFASLFAALGLLIGLPEDVTSTKHVESLEVAATVDDGAALTESHCLSSVDEGLDWWSEGTADYRVIDEDTVQVMQDACDRLGHNSEAFIWEDGSWMVLAKEDFNGPDGLVKAGIWWKGCMSTTAPCAD